MRAAVRIRAGLVCQELFIMFNVTIMTSITTLTIITIMIIIIKICMICKIALSARNCLFVLFREDVCQAS